MILDSTTKTLELVLGSAVTTTAMPIAVDYVDSTATTFTPGSVDSQSNGTTAVTILAAPAASTQRKVNEITVYNADSAAKLTTVRLNNNTTIRPLVVVTLQVGDTLGYTDVSGWYVMDSSGAIKGVGPTGATGATGANGANGATGMPGLDGQDGQDGMSIPGDRGATGPQGGTGPTGPIGWGLPGEDGEDALHIPGPVGPTGATGGGSGRQLAQIVSSTLGTVATGTTIIPQDDTIPQNTEGDQYLSLAITPTNASSTLEIEVLVFLAGAGNPAIALFQDSTASALSAAIGFSSANWCEGINLKYTMTAGTTSATTFKVRGGTGTAGTTTVNGFTSARLYGGAMVSQISIKEYLP